ncbi:MAG: hypothetical protein ACJAVI_003198 [Candidatus Azotimanducaceae bacterium]
MFTGCLFCFDLSLAGLPYDYHWPGTSATFFTGDLLGADGLWQEAFEEASLRWNDTPTSFELSTVNSSGTGFCTSLGNNSTQFQATNCGDQWGSSTLAVAATWFTGTTINKVDIVFNNTQDWDVYDGPLQFRANDFRRVAVHELGHAIGLDHSEEAEAIMFPTSGNSYLVQLDDANTARSIYGSTTHTLTLINEGSGRIVVTPQVSGTGVVSDNIWFSANYPSILDCNAALCEFQIQNGLRLSLEAVASAGANFLGWEGTTIQSQSVNLSPFVGNRTLTAKFETPSLVDSDNDGVFNFEDAFPNDASETTDTDGDGIGDNSDEDIDGDGFSNTDELSAGTDPLSESEKPNPGYVGIRFDNVQYFESDGFAKILVQRYLGTNFDISVDYSVTSASAEDGVDFEARLGTLDWANGDSSLRVINVPLIDNSVADGGFILSVNISNPTGGSHLGNSGSVIWVYDDDVIGAGLAQPSLIGTRQVAASVAEDAGEIFFNVYRNGGTNGEVSVSYKVSSDTESLIVPHAVVGVDVIQNSGVLTWADGDSSERTVVVSIVNDNEVEDRETFNFEIDDIKGNAFIDLGFSTGRSGVEIIDDDTSEVDRPKAGTIGFTTESYRTDENTGVMEVAVTRKYGAKGNVSVAYFTTRFTDDHALENVDYVPTQGSLNWADGDRSTKTFNVAINNDDAVGDLEKNGLIEGRLFLLGLTNIVTTEGVDNATLERRYSETSTTTLAFAKIHDADADPSVDTDLDTIGDTADLDDDGDGVLDIEEYFVGSSPLREDTDNDGSSDGVDAFPTDPSESIDTDNDGMGNNADPDDDEDGTEDNTDNCPLIANQNQADIDGDNIGDICDPVNLDVVPPVITASSPITVTATGLFTVVEFEVTAEDHTDGIVALVPDKAGPFKPGKHLIVWTASDSRGNQSQFEQMLHIEPLVSIPRTLIVSEGNLITVPIRMNGDAPFYPVVLDYSVEGSANQQDHDLVAGFIGIFSGREALLTVRVAPDAEPEGVETIRISLFAASGAVLSEQSEVEVQIVESNLPPQAELTVRQGGRATRLVERGGGDIIISLVSEDPEGDALTIDWSSSTSDLLMGSAQSDSALQIDPSLLTEGNYISSVSVSDGEYTITRRSSFRLVDVMPVLRDTDDSDGDGISDLEEGSGDDDGDGIPDYEDDISDPTQLQGGDTETEVLQTEPGLKLKLGSAALFGASTSAKVTQDTLNQFGGGDGGAGQNVEDTYAYPLGVFDFEVAELPIFGESVSVVIPLLGEIPLTAVYRKYTADVGWNDFVVDDKNEVRSAFSSQLGVCPPLGSVAYTSGVTAGDSCIQLTIEDGGPNDADGTADGKVLDPGGVATTTTEVKRDGDGDGVLDEQDAFPNDASEAIDTDGDGTGDNADVNDDDDSEIDINDAFPLDATETLDTDDDGIGDNADIGIRLGAGQTIELPVVGKTLTSASGATLTIPVDATAVSINVTAVMPNSAGFVTIWPCGVTRPLASNLNFIAGDVRPNGVIASVGNQGSVCLYTQSETDLIVDVAGWFVGNAFAGATPLRLVDTRDGTGGQIGKLTASEPLIVGITSLSVISALGSNALIPQTIDAVSLNITVVNPKAAGFITVYPCDVARPLSSNVNYSAGQVVANSVISPVSADGTVCIYSQSPSDIIVDLAGWLPTTTPASFTGVTPSRLVDTRDGTGGQQGKLFPLAQLSVAVHAAPVSVAGTTFSIPTTAKAAALNVTIVNPEAAGYATVWPCSAERPLASNLNFAAGDVVANNVIAPIDSNGEVCFYTNVASDIIVDIAGYFSGISANGFIGNGFIGSTPKRFLDTRDGTGPRGQ